MRVLGIDPGTLRMGVGVLEAKGSRYALVAFESVRVSKALSLPERLKKIYASVLAFIERYRPDVLALENVFFGKDVRALVKVGEARASAMLAAAEHKIPVVEYPPARVKESISGNGRASKIQVQQMVRHLLQLKSPPPEDAADALAVALCHLHSRSGFTTVVTANPVSPGAARRAEKPRLGGNRGRAVKTCETISRNLNFPLR